jgi:hypothetical protein
LAKSGSDDGGVSWKFLTVDFDFVDVIVLTTYAVMEPARCVFNAYGGCHYPDAVPPSFSGLVVLFQHLRRA